MAIQFTPLPPEAFPEAAQPYIARLNVFLRELSALEGAIRQPISSRRSDQSIVRRGEVQVDVSRITPSIATVVSGASTVVATPALTFGLTNTVGASTSAVSINSAIALFNTNAPPAVDASAGTAGLSSTAANLGHRHQVSTAVPTVGYTTTAGLTGTATTLLRSDATLLAPTFLRSSANQSTLALTDDPTDQTLTGNLGQLNIISGNSKCRLPHFVGGGGSEPQDQSAIFFDAQSLTVGNQIRFGTQGVIRWNDGSTYSAVAATGGVFKVQHASGPTFTNVTDKAVDAQFVAFTPTGTNSWILRVCMDAAVGNVLGANNTVTDYGGVRVLGWPVIGTAGTYTNAWAGKMQLPTIGGTIRRGLWINTVTSNVGTEATNVEGIYVEDIPRGTSRSGVYSEGATTGTPTNVYNYFAAAHGVGTNRYCFYGASDTAYFGGRIQHAGSLFGVFGATPTTQLGTTGTQSGFAAGTSATVTVDSTFTGNTGSLAYTFGDIVLALKRIGVLAT